MANRYWVGGNNGWDGTAGSKWSLTSGGAGGQAIPTSSDDVFFDAASGAVAVTTSITGNCSSINTTGFTGSMTGAGSIVVSGFGASKDITIGAGSVFTTTIGNSATGCILRTNGVILGNLTSTTGSITLADNLSLTGTLNVAGGTFNANNFDISIGTAFTALSTTVRTVNMGSGTWTLSGTGTVMNIATSANITINANTSTLKLTNASATARTLTGGSKTLYNLWVAAGSSVLTFTSSFYFSNNADFTGFTGTTSGAIRFRNSPTMTLRSAGRPILSVTVDATIPGSKLTLLDPFSGAINLVNQGIFDTGNFNTTLSGFSGDVGSTLIIGTSKVTVTSDFTIYSSFNFSALPGSEIIVQPPNATVVSVRWGTGPYDFSSTLVSVVLVSGRTVAFLQGPVTVNLKIAGPGTVTFAAGTTTTLSGWDVNGTAGNLITLKSATNGSNWNLVKSSGIVQSNYISLQDSWASGGAQFLVDVNSIMVSNVTGWTVAVPASTGNTRALIMA